ncbi:MAG: methyl-accepting chemotaxis protein [Halanaeroarchaeum sp.]
MGAIGVTESIERKMMTAVVLQFLTALAIFVLGVALVGPRQILAMFSTVELALFGAVLVLAVLAILNTIYIIRSDFVAPIKSIRTSAEHVANGDLEESVSVIDQSDEVGELSRSFAEMHEYLRVAAAQADAIGDEEFDAEVLEEDIPGSFGESLSQMEANLRDRIDDLETQRAEIQARNEALEQTATNYQQVLQSVAEGDLTRRLDDSTDHDVMADIAGSVNRMLDQIEETIGSLIAFAEEVAAESEDLQTSADEVRDASEGISESIQEISIGVDEEAERLDETADEAENLSATIQEITASSDNVATLTDETAEVGEEGREAAEAAIDEMHAIEDRTEATATAVSELNETLDEIGNISDVILDIAEQTNILALNAGIEAARASEGGEGFAVVADEVKELAEETKQSAEDIGELIDEVQEQSAETATEIDAMTERVDSGVETVEQATDAFERMAKNVSSINTSIQEVSEATADQAESTQDVVAMVEEISSISGQTSAEAQTVAAAAEEQAATLNDVAQNTERLASKAEQLEDTLDQFHLRDGVVSEDITDGHDRKGTDRGGDATGADGEVPGEEPAAADAADMEWQSVATDGGE